MTRPVVAWPSPDGLAPQIEAGGGGAQDASPLGRPVLMVVGAVALFAGADVFAKMLSADLHSMQVAWVRYGLLLAAAVVLARPLGVRVLKPAHPRLQLARAVALLGSGVLFILGLRYLHVAEATAVSFVTPALVTALSIPLLGEVVRRRRWAALLIGLAGVLVVLRPGAVMVILTRRIGSDDRIETTLLWSAALGFVALLATAFAWFQPMGVRLLMLSGAMGGLYAVGQWLLVKAYASGEASMLAPSSYAQVLFAAGLGALVFGALPYAASLSGMALIVAGGAYTLYREGVLARLRVRAFRGWPGQRRGGR